MEKNPSKTRMKMRTSMMILKSTMKRMKLKDKLKSS